MEIVINPNEDALIVVDMQNDFVLPTGALSVPGAPQAIEGINRISASFPFRVQVASLDWHPENHCSFHSQGGPWPVHCVHDTYGAALHSAMDTSRYEFVKKGMHQAYDSYSAFTDDGGEETGLATLLQARGVKRVFVCGVAYDYCVLATAQDAIKAGFVTVLLEDLCHAVSAETAAEAREALVKGRVIQTNSAALCAP